jgi:hypothetical protein
MTARHILLTAIVFAIVSCGQSSRENVTTTSPADIQVFDKALIFSLYQKLQSDFEVYFEEKHLDKLLLNQDIQSLKNGTTIEKEMLFESFECDCYDKLRISYSDDRFVLWVYVEFYEEDLDWCPESAYSYSFLIENHEITDLKLDFMAG